MLQVGATGINQLTNNGTSKLGQLRVIILATAKLIRKYLHPGVQNPWITHTKYYFTTR
jgi:hypothetical protein